MGRQVKDSRLDTREAWLKLKLQHEPYWRLIHEGLHLSYRKGARGGTWLMRVYHPGQAKYLKRSLGMADDAEDSDGVGILDFRQAQVKAIALAKELTSDEALAGPYTVAIAIQDYLSWYAVNKKALHTKRLTCNAHILPARGDCLVAKLTARQLRKWHEGNALSPACLRKRAFAERKFRDLPALDSDSARQRKSSANRILTVLKAALNHAWREYKVKNNEA